MVRTLAALLLLVGVPAFATTVRPLSLAELTAGSDTVVRGRVLGITTARSERSGRLMTRSRIAVLEALKGGPARELELEQLGGVTDGAVSRVPGDAKLETGEEVVLFLRCGDRPRCRLYALGLGKYSVRRSGERVLAIRDATDFSVAGGGELAPAQLPLAELEAAIRGRAR